MMRRLRAWLCQRGFHIACEHRNGETFSRRLRDLDRRREQIERRAEATERELLRVRADLVAAEARRRRRSP